MPAHRIPTALKIINGNPGKRKSDITGGINVSPSMPEPPEHLPEDAAEIFRTTAKLLFDLGTLSKCDAHGLELYARNMVLLRKAHRHVAKCGYYLTTAEGRVYANPSVKVCRDFQALAQRFHIEMGLTAAARSRINITPPSEPKADSFAAKYLT